MSFKDATKESKYILKTFVKLTLIYHLDKNFCLTSKKHLTESGKNNLVPQYRFSLAMFLSG